MSGVMLKDELVQELARRAKLTLVEAENAYNAMCDLISDNIWSERSTRLIGVGTIAVDRKPPRTVQMPGRTEPVAVPERIAVSFKLSRTLTEALREFGAAELSEVEWPKVRAALDQVVLGSVAGKAAFELIEHLISEGQAHGPQWLSYGDFSAMVGRFPGVEKDQIGKVWSIVRDMPIILEKEIEGVAHVRVCNPRP